MSASLQYALDAIALIAVGASLWIGNALVGDFDRTLDEVQEWTNYAVAATYLSDDLLKQQAATAGALSGSDIATNRDRVFKSIAHYQLTDAWLSKQIGEEEFRIYQPAITALLVSSRRLFDRSRATTTSLFAAIGAGDLPMAKSLGAECAALLDQARAKVDAVRELARQSRSIWRQHRSDMLEQSRRVQVATSIALFGLLTFLTFYGHITRLKLQASSRALAEAERLREEEHREADSLVRDRIGTMIDTIDGVLFYTCHVDDKWTAIYLSPAFERMTGYKLDDVIGGRALSLGDLIHPDDRETTKPRGDELSGNAFDLTYRIVTKSGEIKWIYERGRRADDAAAGAVISGFMTDITEMKRLEDAVIDRNRRLETLAHNLNGSIYRGRVSLGAHQLFQQAPAFIRNNA